MGLAFKLWLRLFEAAGTIVQSLGFEDRGPRAKQLVDSTPELDALVLAEVGRSLQASEGAPVSASREAAAARQLVIVVYFVSRTLHGTDIASGVPEGRVAVVMTFLSVGQPQWRIGAISDTSLPESVKRVLDGGPPSSTGLGWVWQPAAP